jgi:hypothetical protein
MESAAFPERVLYIIYAKTWALGLLKKDRRFVDNEKGARDYLNSILCSVGIPEHEYRLELAPEDNVRWYLAQLRYLFANRDIRNMGIFGSRQALYDHVLELEELIKKRNISMVIIHFFIVNLKITLLQN